MRETYVYQVEFKEPINGENGFLYSSLSAIYTDFTPREIGCTVRTLWNYHVTTTNPYVGRKCTIIKKPVKSKKRGI